MPNILVVAETRNGEVRKVTFELITAARALAAGGEVHAVLAGPPATSTALHGVSITYLTQDAAFGAYNAEALASLVAERVKSGGYRAVLFAASAQGKDLGPRVAAKCGAPIASDVLSLAMDGDAVRVTHYVYAGKIIATMKLTATPAVVSLRPGAVESALPADGPSSVTNVPFESSASRVVVTESIRGDSRKLDLADAPVIVSGGRGLKAAENFKLVEELADAFGNAAVGATRAVTDEGWRPHSDQIGQTGRQVSPDLYVAVGISGAIQHLAGMRTSRTIVAINKDKEAPIFKLADYGIVGDVFEIVPALTAAIREAKAKG